MYRTYPLTSLTLVALVGLVGCNDAADEAEPTEGGPGTVGQSLLMQRATSCQDLDAALQADARRRLAASIAAGYYDGDVGVPVGAGGRGTSGPAAPPMAEEPSSDGGGELVDVDGDAEIPEYSETNVQVAGIDEADIVKTDGDNVYVVRDQELTVAHAYPVEELAVVAKQPIEGSPRELFVVPGAAGEPTSVVVYSDVDGAALYAEAGLPTPENSAGSYGLPMIDCWDCYPNFWLPATKVTVLSVADDAVTVDKELYYEGSYLSSRRHGSAIRTILQVPSRAPSLRYYADEADQTKAMLLVLEDLAAADRDVADVPAEDLDAMVRDELASILVAKQEAGIRQITHGDWLPRTFVREEAELGHESLSCEAFYLPAAGSTTAGVTFVAELDLAALDADTDDVAVLGLADTLYENASKVVLSSTWWDYRPATGESSTQTLVHQFDVSEPGRLAYEASGVVPGSVHNQFSLDERDGALRVVTTEDGTAENAWSSSTAVRMLRADGRDLEVVGAVTGLAPTERVYAVRFVGDTAYVVTFRQTDPLFVVDVSDPTAPALLGELEIPGFSEYMHPLGDDHLLTIGRDGDPETGWTTNVALQIFDVGDPADPILAHKHVFAAAGYSAAESNHKAFSFFAEEGLLALPFYGETWDSLGYYRTTSSLELFDVSIDEGFSHLGAIDGNVLLSAAERSSAYYCDTYAASSIERGLTIGEHLYAVGERGIIVSPLDAPAEPVARVAFDDPAEVPDYCWAANVGGSGGAPSAGGTTGEAGAASGGAVGGASSDGVGGTGAI